jgi:hypothetical protein
MFLKEKEQISDYWMNLGRSADGRVRSFITTAKTLVLIKLDV